MLSNACKYAIRAIIYLAMHSDVESKIGVKKIAEELEVPQPFLAQLLRQLTTNKLVSSTKGPGGGFFLDAKSKKISLWDIVSSIDGTEKFDSCFMGLSQCNDKDPCPVHFIVSPFRKKILGVFKDKTISEVADEIKRGRSIISLKDLTPGS